MNITWLGHGGFRLEIENSVILVDPWLDGNPSFPKDRRKDALTGTTHILLTHGHFDHSDGIAEIVGETGAPIFAMVELAGILETQGLNATGFNLGGSVDLDGVDCIMVPAAHSSSIMIQDRLVYAGAPNGFVLRGDDHVTYVSGDTGITAEMGMIGSYLKPDIGILSAGGHFTMDMKGAAWAAKNYFDFKTVIPCHYQTFPLLAQSAEELVEGLPGVDVLTPGVMETVKL